MCDLIDLNSPDTKSLLGPKLASPLIPVPTDNHSSRMNEPSSLIIGKRDSLDNNPFDMVLHKTTEYIQKKDDPFELALEKALKSRQKKSITSRTSSIDLTSDLTPKREKNSQNLKMNRTLDESQIDRELNSLGTQKRTSFIKMPEESRMANHLAAIVTEEKRTTDDANLSFSKHDYKIPTIDIQNADLSILNQSVMNDTLSETSCGSVKDQFSLQKRITSDEKDTIDIKQLVASAINLKVPKLRRSLSQGEKMSPRKIQYLNRTSQLILENSRANSLSGTSTISSIGSSNSSDPFNKGFLRSQYSGSSIFSSLSNISAITRINSVSSTNNSSMILSNGTINRTFLESCSSDKTSSPRLNERMDSIKETSPRNTNNTHSLISDLADRFGKLKTSSNQPDVPGSDTNEKDIITLNDHSNSKNATPILKNAGDQNHAENKLIDVDIFTPDMNSSKDHSKTSISDTSSDSVFIEGNKINKSILREATALARTFEELALKTSSGSSVDDLITSNPSWMSELLPAFEDEALEQNLIELPTSPNINNENIDLPKEKQTDNCVNGNELEKNMKDLEIELIEPVPVENKITAATLLFDLKKLVKSENNSEAHQLLENLGKVLGVECKNNTELLSTYLNTTNNLAKSPQKSNSSVDIIKNVEQDCMERSEEENLNTDSLENTKESTINENINLNDTNTSKCFDGNQKYLNHVPDISKNLSIKTDNITDNSVEKTNTPIRTNGSEIKETSKTETTRDFISKEESCNSSNEKVAIELLANLAKLLNGETEEQSTLELLRNLGRVLNFASGNYNAIAKTETDNTYPEIQQTPKKPKAKSEIKKVRTEFLSRSANRLSLDLEAKKKTSEKTSKLLRRSTSISHSPPIKTIPSPVTSKDKNIGQLKDVKKRFPSDPGFINSTSNKRTVPTNSDVIKVCPTTKGQQTKSAIPMEKQKEKVSTIVSTVKSRLKKKIDAEVTIKKGPMKAIHPVGNMQRRDSFSKKSIPSVGTVTPPKLHKIISSTPNSTNSGSAAKKSPRSKPVASSTPDAQISKNRKIQSQPNNCGKKRNFSCDISPVTTHSNVTSSTDVKASSKIINQLPSPKKSTPKRRQADSSIPKSLTPPVFKRANSSFEVTRNEKLSDSPQRSLKKGLELRRNSPSSLKKNSEKLQQSPLRDSNKISPKVKPFNLISKLRRHSNGSGIIEKENFI